MKNHGYWIVGADGKPDWAAMCMPDPRMPEETAAANVITRCYAVGADSKGVFVVPAVTPQQTEASHNLPGFTGCFYRRFT
jgi:hypothetical protein